jgi:hypothetical protein
MSPRRLRHINKSEVQEWIELFAFVRRPLTIRFHESLLLQRCIKFLKQGQELLAVHLLRSFGCDNAPGTRDFLLFLQVNSERDNTAS